MTYDESNPSGTEVLSNSNGCDSTVTITLTYNNTTSGTETYTGCTGDGYAVVVNGITYNESNPSGTEVLSNSNGCDSTVTIDLTFNTSVTGTENYTGCSGDGYVVVVNGITYDEGNPSGTEVLTAVAGCDSTVTITLTYNNTTSGTETYTGCTGDGYAVVVNGITYDESNPSGTEVLSNSNGCDSTVTITLTFNISTSSAISHTGCLGDGYAVVVNGVAYDESNPSGTEVFSNSNGCDSTVTIDLSFSSSVSGTESYTGCSGDGYTVVVNGVTYDESNPSGTEMLTALAGCDSIVTINLNYNTILPGTDVQTACDSYDWIDGNTYTTSNNIATTIVSSSQGCDSLVTLDLTIYNSTSSSDIHIACENFTWIDGNTYTNTNNSATVILQTIHGCDSIITLDLTINPLPSLLSFTGEGTYCEGDEINTLIAEVSGAPNFTLDYTLDGNPLSISSSNSIINLGNTSGVYVLTVVSDNFCSATLTETQTITINPFPNAPDVSEDQSYCANAQPLDMQASGSTGTYTWYSDAALTQILGNSDSYTPDVIVGTTTYYVTATENGCEGNPEAIVILFEDCSIIIPTAFTPDYDQVNDTWELENIDNIYPNNVVSVYNRFGNKVYESKPGVYNTMPWDGTHQGNELPVASYYFIIEYNDNSTENKTGIVTIIK
jgi:gliding motility-associated-like protein